MSVGNALKEARMNVGVTQEQVAQNLFVTRQTVSRWEQDKTLPNVHVILLLKRQVEALFETNDQLKSEVTQDLLDQLRTQINAVKGSEKTILTQRINHAQQLFLNTLVA
ncbi:helix-turn-helix transcriptional regulator, partial [Latilactobacillus curvatus]